MMELGKTGWRVTSGKEGSQLCCQLHLYYLHASREEASSNKTNQTR